MVPLSTEGLTNLNELGRFSDEAREGRLGASRAGLATDEIGRRNMIVDVGLLLVGRCLLRGSAGDFALR